MSVDDPRPAAAQRTAAPSRPRRRALKVAATWLLVVPLLTMFSFSVVASAKTLEKPDVAGAVEQLPNASHVVEVAVAPDGKHGENDGGPSVRERFTHLDHLVCSVNATLLAAIEQRYTTSRFTVDVRNRSLDVVAVYGANATSLRSYLGAPGMRCVLVQVKRVFFLPFDAHTS